MILSPIIFTALLLLQLGQLICLLKLERRIKLVETQKPDKEPSKPSVPTPSSTPPQQTPIQVASADAVIQEPTVFPIPVPQVVPPKNKWTLDISSNGDFAFIIPWSDGGMDFIKGSKVGSYEFLMDRSVHPDHIREEHNTSEGFNFQWSLNGFHWS